jgi:hypothetical protein
VVDWSSPYRKKSRFLASLGMIIRARRSEQAKLGVQGYNREY